MISVRNLVSLFEGNLHIKDVHADCLDSFERNSDQGLMKAIQIEMTELKVIIKSPYVVSNQFPFLYCNPFYVLWDKQSRKYSCMILKVCGSYEECAKSSDRDQLIVEGSITAEILGLKHFHVCKIHYDFRTQYSKILRIYLCESTPILQSKQIMEGCMAYFKTYLPYFIQKSKMILRSEI